MINHYIDNKEMFIHIGIHKTGTTFLQNDVFPFLTEINYLPRKFSIEELVSIDEKPILISHESLSGRPWDRNTSSWLDDFKLHISRLSDAFPNAKIIICFRNHTDLLVSLYKQYLKEGGTGNIRQLLDLERDNGIIKKTDLCFMERIDFIIDRFNHDPFIFLYDELKFDFVKFMSDLFVYIDIEGYGIGSINNKYRNIGVDGYRSKILRLLNTIDNTIPLNNNPLGKVGIHPRKLCQDLLSFLPTKPIKLNDTYKCFVENNYTDDWNGVLDCVSKFRRISKNT